MANDSYQRIGLQLACARKEHGVRLAEISNELRISCEYLRLLEIGDFDNLPAPTYVSGFLRSYGNYLGLDGAQLAARYYALHGDATITTEYKMPVTGGPPQRSAPAVASVCVVLAVIAYGGWYWFNGVEPPTPEVVNEMAVLETVGQNPKTMEKNAINKEFEVLGGITPDVETVNENVIPTTESSDGNTYDLAKTGLKKPAISGNESFSEVSSSNIESEPVFLATNNLPTNSIESVETKIIGVNENINSNDVTQEVSVASEGRIESLKQIASGRSSAVANLRAPDQEITIRAKASSWVEIVRNDGSSVFTKLMKSGETYVVDDSSNLYLSTGNAGGIELVTFDNSVIKIGAVGEIVRDLPLDNDRLRDRF